MTKSSRLLLKKLKSWSGNIFGTAWKLCLASWLMMRMSPCLSRIAEGSTLFSCPPIRNIADCPNDIETSGAYLLGSEWSTCPLRVPSIG